MKSILLSIKPKWAEKILSGEKNCELRRQRINLAMDNYQTGTPTVCYLYATAPTKAIVGEVLCTGVGVYPIQSIMFGPDFDYRIKDFSKQLKDLGLEHCVPFANFRAYFETAKAAFAYKLENPHLYHKPMSLSDFGLTRAPQSWCYVKGGEK